MNVKDKVLVGIIADMENAARNQDNYIENLDDKLSCAEDAVKELTEKASMWRETSNVFSVSLSKQKGENAGLELILAEIETACKGAGIDTEVCDQVEMVERLISIIKGQSCETCNAHGYRLKYRRLVDCIKRNIDDTTRGLLGDVLRQHNTNEANRGKK